MLNLLIIFLSRPYNFQLTLNSSSFSKNGAILGSLLYCPKITTFWQFAEKPVKKDIIAPDHYVELYVISKELQGTSRCLRI